MATIKEKMTATQSAKPKKVMADNFDNIKMSKDQHIAYYRKQEEIDAKLELQRQELQEKAEEELKALENAGMQDNAENEQKIENEEV